VLPCRTHGEDDKDYALSFAVPLSAKGIKLLAVEPVTRRMEKKLPGLPDDRCYAATECLIVFDDVFIPGNEFLCAANGSFHVTSHTVLPVFTDCLAPAKW